jgi:hypothetical protein
MFPVQARSREIRMPQKKDTCAVSRFRRLFGNRWIAAAGHFLESLLFSARVPRLSLRTDAEFLAANGAAARENGLAVRGLHASPKTVGFHATPVIRLKGSFRHCGSVRKYRLYNSLGGSRATVPLAYRAATARKRSPLPYRAATARKRFPQSSGAMKSAIGSPCSWIT